MIDETMKTTRAKVPEVSEPSTGNLQKSINRSLEFTKNNKAKYQKGETKSTNHLIYEMNEFYLEMAQKINELGVKRYDDNVKDEEDDEEIEDTDSVLYEVITAIKKKRNDPEIRKQIEACMKLDQLMEETYKTLKEENEERLSIQAELCDIIEQNDTAPNAKTRYFKYLCDIETKKCNSTKINQLQEENLQLEAMEREQIAQKSQTNTDNCENKDAKFIKRNIQLAKSSSNMLRSGNYLTDEEKLTLNTILSDLDHLENEESSVFEEPDDDSSDDCTITSDLYGYSMSEEDKTRLLELESKIKELSERPSTSEELKKTVRSNADEGKHWLNESRLKQIDEKLEKLQNERKSFTFAPHDVPPPSAEQEVDDISDDNDETINEVNSISMDTICERSQDMLDAIANIITKIDTNSTDEIDKDDPGEDATLELVVAPSRCKEVWDEIN